ncbi:MAG TPA: NADPH-dependent FMN reductase [Desulforhopalus sp.]|nr:NADPH-dependent FMN reductase [Desulforhopalus sp.]
MKILGISGSLRNGSYNTRLLYTAMELLPSGTVLTLADCAAIPLYNKDLDGAEKPPAVLALSRAICAADGLLIATPEYNHSFSGVLKNTIDWVSRPANSSVLANKPTAIVSAAKGHVGGARAQAHLRQVLASTLTPVLNAPPLLVPAAQEIFPAEGPVHDGETRRRLERYLLDFVDWLYRVV